MNPRVLLHVGPHKTGTTYVQQAFSEAAAFLHGQGIHYPLDHEPRGHGHHSVAKQLVESQHSESLAAYLNDCPAGHDLLLSSENFSRLAPEAVAGLARQLGAKEVAVVYTVRPVADALFSNWQQQVKVGRSEPWSEFVLSHLAAPAASPIINPMPTLNAYQQAFPQSVRLLDYAGVVSSRKNIANAVLEAGLGRELPEFAQAAANASLPLSLAEVVRALNVVHTQKTGRECKGFRVYRAARRLLRKPSDELSALRERVETFSQAFDASVLCAHIPVRVDFMAAYADRFTGPRGDSQAAKALQLPRAEWLQDKSSLELLSAVYDSLDFDRRRSEGVEGKRASSAALDTED
jgi:hypothetical protein